MSTIDSGLGWSCDSNFLFSEAQTLVTFPNGNIIKKNPGAAIVAAWHNNGSPASYGVTMISPDSSTFAELETDSNDIYVGTVTSEVHDGVTWYVCDAWNQTPAYSQNESYHTEKLPLLNTSLGYSGAPNAVVTIINESRFEFTVNNIPTVDYVKAFVEGVEAETATRVNALNTAKQPKTMSAAITVDGVSQTTVENAIGAINDFTSAKISDIYANLGIYGDDVYGLQVDFENYIYTRLCGAVGKTAGTDFNSIAPWSGMKRCNLADNGTVNAYYGDNNYVEDGLNGQVMVEIPKFYYRVVPLKTEDIGDSVGGKHLRKANYYISATKYEGFKTHPAFVKPDGTERNKAYISAYEGCIYDVSESAYILDDAQVADFTASTGDRLSSIASAKPASGSTQNLTRANSEVIATNRGTGWHCMDVKSSSAVQLLFMIEFGTLNSQNAIGLGVVNKASGSENESENTGATSSLGNSTGMASGTNGLVSVSYRGVENLYGNIWKFVNGVNIWGDGTLRGGQPYICDDYNFVESTKTGYTAVKFTVTNNTNAYISSFGYDFDFDWLFLPSECINADSNYPVGDFVDATPNLNDYRISLLGARWDNGTRAGAFYNSLEVGTGFHTRVADARLMYLP